MTSPHLDRYTVWRAKKCLVAVEAGCALEAGRSSFDPPQDWWPELAPLNADERRWVKAKIAEYKAEGRTR